MYTLDTNTLLNLGTSRCKTVPDWFDSEQYYNCEDFFSILSRKMKKDKRVKKNHR